MAKGLVQNATRRQALSYRRYAPNPIGVTSIAAINGRGAAGRGAAAGRARANKRRASAGRPAPVVVIEQTSGRKKTLRGASAQAYLRKKHPKHYKKSDFGRLRLGFTTRTGERVSISPKATSRRTSDLAAREARLARSEKALAKKVAAKRSRRREVEYVAGARVYKSRAAYERARALLDRRERAAKRRRGKPTQAALRRASKTLEKGKRKGRKTVSRRKSYKHDLQKLPMRSYYASKHGGRIKGSPVIGISEEDVVVVPARRNGRKKHTHTTKFHGRRRKYTPTAAEKAWYKWHNAFKKQHGSEPTYGDVAASAEGQRLSKAAEADEEARHSEWVNELERKRSKGRTRSGSKAKKARKVSRRKWSSPPKRRMTEARRKHMRAASMRHRRWLAKHFEGTPITPGIVRERARLMSHWRKSISKARGASGKKRESARYKAAMQRFDKRHHITWSRFAKNGHGDGEDMRRNKKRKLSGAAKAAHDKRVASGKRATHHKGAHKRTRRSSGKRASASGLLSVKIGGKTFRTYMVKGKGGKVVHVPRYKLLGFKSERALQKVLQGSDEKKAERISKKLQSIYRRRAKAAARVQKHGDVFTPNARRKHRYEDWSEDTMKANKRKGRKSGRKGHTKASRRSAARKAAETRKLKRAKRSAAARKAARTRKRHHAERSASSRKGRKSAKRSGRKSGHYKPRKAGKGRKRSRSAAGKARWRAMSSAKKAKVLAALRRGREKARGSHRSSRKGKGKARYAKNHSTALANRGSSAVANRRHHHSHIANRHYRRNKKFTMNGFGESVKDALESGAIATAGFIAHRGLGWVLSEKLLATIGVFADATTSPTGTAGSMAPYRRVVAGAVVGAAGIVLVEKAMPKQATMLAAGIVVSFLQQIIVTAMGQVAPAYVPAVSGYGGYGDRSGRAFRVYPGGIGRPMGEYFLTGQNGYGEYFLTGQNGFGATEGPGRRRRHIAAAGYGGVSQAAAGFGQISQAAAGYGQISQAAAGYGQSPMLSQAAAGVGEYFLTGANGIGEYESVMPSGQSGAATVTDEGIQGGDTNAAERALNIAEGVAGVSDDNGIGVSSIVDPTDVAVPVSDEPQGSRAGILAGGEGIFGGAL